MCLGEVDLEIHQDVFLEPQVLTRHRSDMEAGKIWLQQITGFLVPYLWLCTNTDTHTNHREIGNMWGISNHDQLGV